MIVHNFDPVFIDLGVFQIRWYSIAYIVGIILGWIYAIKIIKEMAKKHNFTLTHEFDTIIGDTVCYNVKLIGTTEHGCIDSTETTICVYPDPIAELSLESIQCFCAPLQIDTLGIFAIDWPQANDSVTWEVWNSSGVLEETATGLTIPSYVIQNDDDYVWVVITAHNSCGTDTDSIQVCTIDDPIADFTISDTRPKKLFKSVREGSAEPTG